MVHDLERFFSEGFAKNACSQWANIFILGAHACCHDKILFSPDSPFLSFRKSVLFLLTNPARDSPKETQPWLNWRH